MAQLAAGWHGIGQLPPIAALGAIFISALVLGLAACWMAGSDRKGIFGLARTSEAPSTTRSGGN